MAAQKNEKPNAAPRKVTVLGLGLFGGGAGAARYWAEKGAQVTVTDLRPAAELSPALADLADLPLNFTLGRHQAADFTDADLVMVNPAVAPGNEFVRLAAQAGATICSEIGLALCLHPGPLLAVSGSNGKSTTASLLAALVKAQFPAARFGGNIGGSLLTEISQRPPDAATPLIVELSSFQLHYLRPAELRPAVAVLTNLSPNHLDWHPDLAHYYNAKRQLLKAPTASQWAVLNGADAELKKWGQAAAAEVVFTQGADPDLPNCAFLGRDDFILRLNGQKIKLAPRAACQLPGAHNAQNALQALVAAYLFCQKTSGFAAALKNFRGLPHRLEDVTPKGAAIKFINDSIATTPESVCCALASFQNRHISLLAGGYDKQTDLTPLAAAIVKYAASVALIGQTGAKIAAKIKTLAADFPLKVFAADFAAAFDWAVTQTPAGGIVLLSPGCASYDMFANFQARGQEFAARAAACKWPRKNQAEQDNQ